MKEPDLVHPSLQKVIEKKGFGELTKPQLQAIPKILAGKNCLLIAPTGMGKTEAALIPIFHLYLNTIKTEGISILYITPLRALNRDMLKRTLLWGEKLGIDVAVRHGDTSQKERRAQSKKPPDMLITTPETFQVLFTGKNLRASLKDVKWVIIDEIHELAGSDRGAQLSVALERLVEIAGDFQRVGLSATIGTPGEVARFLGGERDVNIVRVGVKRKMKINVEMPLIGKGDGAIARRIKCDTHSAALLRRAMEVINTHNATLFFVNTRDAAEMLASRLHELGVPIEVHHGSLSKEVRIEGEEKFKGRDIKALLCTSSLELGIDVGHTDFVLQYSSPRQVIRLLQRVGRSGHSIGKTSKGLILATAPEDVAESMVIATRAMKGKLEEIRVRKNPLSVLANQIISLCVEYGKMNAKEVYMIIKRAYPFSALEMDVFLGVVKQLHRQRVIWFDGRIIERKKKSREYFLDNISMIPDEKSTDVVDISSNKKIGKLDEHFVMNCCSVGTRFIMKGRAWEIVKIDERVLVAPSGKTRVIPDWVGEEIPVPFEVAREVGKMRRKALDNKDVPLQVKEEVERQLKGGFAVPTDKTVTIEVERDRAYVTTHFGSRTNETFGRLIASFLSQRSGGHVEVRCNAYCICLRSSHVLNPEMIKDVFHTLTPEVLKDILKIILRNSSFIRWEVVKVARKFGVLSKDAVYDFLPDRMIDIFEGYPLVDEVFERVIWERMDIEHAQHVLRELKEEKIAFVTQKISPISLERERGEERWLYPVGFDVTILSSVNKRLQRTRIAQVCVNCFYSWDTIVERTRISCPKCKGRMLATLKSTAMVPARETLRKDEREYRRLYKNASLVATYGKDAIIVMAGYGIGVDTAARILAKQKRGDELLEEIVKAEITYSKTRQFWS